MTVETNPPEPGTFIPWLRDHAQAISLADAAIAIEILRRRLLVAAPSGDQMPDGSAVVFLLRGQLVHGVVAHTTASGIASVEVRRHDGGLERMKVPVSLLRTAPVAQTPMPR